VNFILVPLVLRVSVTGIKLPLFVTNVQGKKSLFKINLLLGSDSILFETPQFFPHSSKKLEKKSLYHII